jgi:hypothetical protein
LELITSGTFVGAGSFRCRNCDYVLTLEGPEKLNACPACDGEEFVRASLFATQRAPAGEETEAQESEGTLSEPQPADHDSRLQKAREQLKTPGQYICYEENGELRTVALTREWTRIGRSLAADVRFDDQTVSRRHALIVRHPDGVRVLDDRSLNGVFVNDARIEGKVLEDGDEIIVGRHRLSFISIGPEPGSDPSEPGSSSLRASG